MFLTILVLRASVLIYFLYILIFYDNPNRFTFLGFITLFTILFVITNLTIRKATHNYTRIYYSNMKINVNNNIGYECINNKLYIKSENKNISCVILTKEEKIF